MIGGHGHVNPRPDGAKARCGGPGICPECSRETPVAQPMKPLWLLDVDGVLNAVNVLSELQSMPEDACWPDYRKGRAESGRRPGHTFQIIWSPTLIERITALHESGRVEIRWLTTWEERAQTEIAPLLGLPHFELAGKRNLKTEGRWWWKLPIAQAATAPERALVWTDDDLPGVPEAKRWMLRRFEERGGKSMLVSPKFDVGISSAQMDAIEAFLTGDLEYLLKNHRAGEL